MELGVGGINSLEEGGRPISEGLTGDNLGKKASGMNQPSSPV